jgi:TolB-like protein
MFVKKIQSLALFFFLLCPAFIFGQFYSGDGGRGIVIAVPAPVMRNAAANDNWMPQLFQDLMTGDLARFSAMTVIDRSNEELVLAEQTLSASGNYSDNDYVRMGSLTNARYIVAGSIQNISGRYNVSFRINNTETNEIRTTYSKAYALADIESGLAAKEAVKELLAGMGVALTASGERTLLTVQAVEAKATAQLARGTVAARNDNLVDALSFLYQASEAGSTRQEATAQINNLSFTVATGSIRERANAGIALQEKWKKIIADLSTFMLNNSALCLIYDFSTVEDEINYNSRTVNFTIKPGIQIVGNRTVVLVWQKLYSEFQKVSGEEFMRGINFPSLPRDTSGGFGGYTYIIKISLYDELSDKIADNSLQFMLILDTNTANWRAEPQPLLFAQERYYFRTDEDLKTRRGYQGTTSFRFNGVPLNLITDVITPKIESVSVMRGYDVWAIYRGEYMPINIPWYTPREWQEWLAGQGNAR